MNKNQQIWYQNKIQGSLAEEISMNHFQYLGFDVSRCDIESVALDLWVSNSNKVLLDDLFAKEPIGTLR